jgi:hypothetical protein
LEIELAKLGIKIDDLVNDAEDVPELREAMKLLSRDAKVKLALEWFGDQGHPQPEKRTRPIVATFDGEPVYGSRTPDWGRLPRLEDDTPEKHDRGGRPHKKHPGIALKEAARMIVNGEENKAAISRSATTKAREGIDAEEIVANKWESGFTERDDVDLLRAAIDSGLVAWTPKGLVARETRRGVFRHVDDFVWLEIPEPE